MKQVVKGKALVPVKVFIALHSQVVPQVRGIGCCECVARLRLGLYGVGIVKAASELAG